MKYYISDLKITNIDKMYTLKTCIKKEEHYTLIFSLEGIFKIKKNNKNSNNVIQKINYKDKEPTHLKINAYDFLKDNSECFYTDVSQIPMEHFSQKIKMETYTLRENSPLKFIIIKDCNNNNNIIDFYFDTNELDNKYIIEDLLIFLSFEK
jgi:hypothetical protein